MRKWLPLIILASAQFVMVLDSSVMNVSISQIVADLDTTVTGVQSAITMYTLVMAAFMLVGAKLGDIWGRDRTFGLGLAVYGTGSAITSISPNLTTLLFGWSLVEGLGAVLVIPAIAALTAANYEGKDRAFAYGMIGGAAGAAIAAGPLIGGWVTTNLSWRYVFIGEVVVVIAILIVHRYMKRAPKPEEAPKLDLGGAALSAIALGLIVFGILKSSTWGWIYPIDAPTIAGHEVTPFGFSVVPFLIVGGFAFLGCFLAWEERRERRSESTLLDRALLKIGALRGGLLSLCGQQLILMGTFFVLPVYLQVVLGFDAFETGKRLFPMSISMLAAALTGSKLAASIRSSGSRAGRPRSDGDSGSGSRRDDRRDAERDGLCAVARLLRYRRRVAHVATRQRDHVLRTAGADERGRGPSGDSAEPRRIPRHGSDRIRPASRAAERIQQPDRAESGSIRRGQVSDRICYRDRDPDRHD